MSFAAATPPISLNLDRLKDFEALAGMVLDLESMLQEKLRIAKSTTSQTFRDGLTPPPPTLLDLESLSRLLWRLISIRKTILRLADMPSPAPSSGEHGSPARQASSQSATTETYAVTPSPE